MISLNTSWLSLGSQELFFKLTKIKTYLNCLNLTTINRKTFRRPIIHRQSLQLLVDLAFLKENLILFSIIKSTNLQPAVVFFLVFQSSISIIRWFKTKVNAYLNWFCCVMNYSTIKNLVDYTIRYCLIKTLASKHNLSKNKIILIYFLYRLINP